MVVDIFVSQRLAVNPLSQQLIHEMFDKDGVALVPKAAGQPARHSKAEIGLTQQQHATIGGERAARKIDDDFSGTQVLKEQRLVPTLCRRRSGGG